MMKEYEIWSGDLSCWISSWDSQYEASAEINRLEEIADRDYYLRRNMPDGTVLYGHRRKR